MIYSKRKINWKHVGILLLAVITIALVLLTPMFNEMVNATRSKPGYGSECLLWLFPLSAIIFLVEY